jgi:nitrate/nitrite transport system ATP-binding protein
MRPAPVLEFSNLGKAFPSPQGPPAVIVKDFNLEVSEGEFICIIGHSGCGKSTVLSIVMGLAEASQGGVMLDGREIDGPGTDRGVVFQSPSLFPWFTAEDNVDLAVAQARPGMPKPQRLALARKHLAGVGLGDAGGRWPDEMSAGMRQRVGIARAFAMEPKVLLLDEPFSLLDALTRMELQDELIRVWESDRKTVVMVTP